jgi:hypothetical protein
MDENPWTPPQNDDELHGALPQLLAIRVLCAVLLGVPATCLFPFAIWIAVASVKQIYVNSSPLSVFVLAVSVAGIAGFFCLWWFVFFGLQGGVLGLVQITGIVIGVLIMLIVITIQFSQSF